MHSLQKNWPTYKFSFGKMALLLGMFFVLNTGRAQHDSIPDSLIFSIFRHKLVLFADYGFNTAPINISFKDTTGSRDRFQYRNNLRTAIGFGFSYKWAALRLAFNLPGNVFPVAKYGKTTFFDLGFEFKTKKRFYDFDLHNYSGYVLKDAHEWNDSLAQDVNPNLILSNMNSLSASLNCWRFFNKKIVMAALKGKTGMYHRKQNSFYLKTTFNLFGVSNNVSIIPDLMQNHKVTKTGASTISAFDFGFLPGYVHVDRYKNWQYSAMVGLGGVIQYKSYYSNGTSRSFLGLAPRVDVRLIAGYNVPKWFVNLVMEFDNKSIRFQDMRYAQTYSTIRLVAGMRIR